jgi:hypothetical protein
MHGIHMQKLQTSELIDNKIKVMNPMHDDSCNNQIDVIQLELRMQKSINKIKVMNPMHNDSCNNQIDVIQWELRMQKNINLRKRLLSLKMEKKIKYL